MALLTNRFTLGLAASALLVVSANAAPVTTINAPKIMTSIQTTSPLLQAPMIPPQLSSALQQNLSLISQSGNGPMLSPALEVIATLQQNRSVSKEQLTNILVGLSMTATLPSLSTQMVGRGNRIVVSPTIPESKAVIEFVKRSSNANLANISEADLADVAAAHLTLFSENAIKSLARSVGYQQLLSSYTDQIVKGINPLLALIKAIQESQPGTDWRNVVLSVIGQCGASIAGNSSGCQNIFQKVLPEVLRSSDGQYEVRVQGDRLRIEGKYSWINLYSASGSPIEALSIEPGKDSVLKVTLQNGRTARVALSLFADRWAKDIRSPYDIYLPIEALSADGKRVLINDGTRYHLISYEQDGVQTRQTLNPFENARSTAVFSPDGQKILVRTDNSVDVWDVASFKLLVRLSFPGGSQYVEVSPDGKIVVAVGRSSIELADLESGVSLSKVPNSNWSLLSGAQVSDNFTISFRGSSEVEIDLKDQGLWIYDRINKKFVAIQ